MKTNFLKITCGTALAFAFVCGEISYARPPLPPPGGHGFRPGPSFRPGHGFGPGPVHRSPWRHFGRDVLGGTLAIGLGLGLANAITNAAAPYNNSYYTAPSYVPPVYPVSPVISTPVVTTPLVATSPVPTVTVPSVSVPGKMAYWCQATQSFFPMVTECSSGWEAKLLPN